LGIFRANLDDLGLPNRLRTSLTCAFLAYDRSNPVPGIEANGFANETATGETVRETNNAYRAEPLVSETRRNAGEEEDARRTAHKPAMTGPCLGPSITNELGAPRRCVPDERPVIPAVMLSKPEFTSACRPQTTFELGKLPKMALLM
jgi:hypothetical protein